MQKSKYTVVLLLCLINMGCSTVSPWEKGQLARPEMALNHNPLEQRLMEHVFFAKEASSSGSAVSGGGCGCN